MIIKLLLFKEGFVSLEKGLTFPLPKMLTGKTIKQIEVIPKQNHFEVVIINLGKKTNQNLGSNALGRCVDKLCYKLENHGIMLEVIDESYTSKASFMDGDECPKRFTVNQNHHFSGKRVKRGLYRTHTGLAVNADVNGAYNILRKSNLEFSFAELLSKINDGILGWFRVHG